MDTKSSATGRSNGSTAANRRVDGESPSVAIAIAVAETLGRAPHELQPLHDVVDPDSLDALLDGSVGTATLSFTYVGCRVQADGDTVRITRDD